MIGISNGKFTLLIGIKNVHKGLLFITLYALL